MVTPITGVVSALFGVALVHFLDRWLRHRGKLYCQVEGFGGAIYR
jgi:hypothetical protein